MDSFMPILALGRFISDACNVSSDILEDISVLAKI